MKARILLHSTFPHFPPREINDGRTRGEPERQSTEMKEASLETVPSEAPRLFHPVTGSKRGSDIGCRRRRCAKFWEIKMKEERRYIGGE